MRATLVLLAALLTVVTAAPLHRNYVYAHFLRDGTGPNWADFTRELSMKRSDVEDALDALAKDHDIVLLPSVTGSPSRQYMLMCHPFSNLPTAHKANHDIDAVTSYLTKLTKSVPMLNARLFLKAPRTKFYGN